MIELPEAATLARQLTDSLRGQCVVSVMAAASPHKFAWYHGDPADYADLLCGKTVGAATSFGGLVAMDVDDVEVVFSDGVALRRHAPGEPLPSKHQLLLRFADDSALSASVQMYGGLWAAPKGSDDNHYHTVARAAPSPLGDAFDEAHFASLFGDPKAPKLSVKALLATEQRIPGLGNGVLQDILYAARLHPKRKIAELTAAERDGLFWAVKLKLAEMTRQGGRDTEKDLHGEPGGYRTRLSRHTVGQPCGECGATIAKEAYLGGAVYWCPGCQRA